MAKGATLEDLSWVCPLKNQIDSALDAGDGRTVEADKWTVLDRSAGTAGASNHW